MLRQRMILGCLGAAILLLAGCPHKGGAGGTTPGGGTSGASAGGTGGTKPGGTGGTGGSGMAGTGTAGTGTAGTTSTGGTTGAGGTKATGGTTGAGGTKATGGTGGTTDPGTGGSFGGGVCNLLCVQGKHCELVQVTCVRAPCPPLPQCVDDAPAGGPLCGGIAGRPCPGLAECVDNPTDNCDPKQGGADCGGLCVCNKGVLCVKGMVWNHSPSVCACVPETGPVCGKTTCRIGEECCNASCGTCVSPGGACTQQVCL